MSLDWFWPLIQIVGLLSVPVAALQAARLWILIRTGRFVYRPLRGNGVFSTRAERPGWYWFAVVNLVTSLAVSLGLIGFVGYWTFHAR